MGTPQLGQRTRRGHRAFVRQVTGRDKVRMTDRQFARSVVTALMRDCLPAAQTQGKVPQVGGTTT